MQKTALHKLSFYQNEYIPRRNTLQQDHPLPSGINRYITPKGPPPTDLAKISTGDVHAVKSYVKLEFIKTSCRSR